MVCAQIKTATLGPTTCSINVYSVISVRARCFGAVKGFGNSVHHKADAVIKRGCRGNRQIKYVDVTLKIRYFIVKALAISSSCF